jgi:PAS domain S-box-containing protein
MLCSTQTSRERSSAMLVAQRFSAAKVALARAAGGALAAARRTRLAEAVGEKPAHDMFRWAFESCPSGMVVFGPDDRIVMVNSEVERLFGYGREELIGASVDHLVPGGLGAASKPAPSDAGTLHGVRKNGSRFAVEVRSSPIARDGTLALGVIVDISDRLRHERLKDEFVSTVSHELRTPLTSIAGSLGLLVGGAGGQMPPSTMRLLTIAHKNSERLVRLINDILDIEKMESGRVVFDLKRVDAFALIEQVADSNRGYAEGFGVQVRFESPSTPAIVRADPDRLTQVVTNLLSNAVKFSPPGAEVVISVVQDGGKIRILVRDHGAGIPESFRPHIFEKFAQADAADGRRKGGTGLGLSIVKQIVILLGGVIGFESPIDGGTLFFVDLPAWDLTIDPAVPLSQPHAEKVKEVA